MNVESFTAGIMMGSICIIHMLLMLLLLMIIECWRIPSFFHSNPPPEKRKWHWRHYFDKKPPLQSDTLSTYLANFSSYRPREIKSPGDTVITSWTDKHLPAEVLIHIISYIPNEWLYVNKTWNWVARNKTTLLIDNIRAATSWTDLHRVPHPRWVFAEILLHMLRYNDQHALAMLLRVASEPHVLGRLRMDGMFTSSMWISFVMYEFRTEALFNFLRSEMMHNWLLTIWCNGDAKCLESFYLELFNKFRINHRYIKVFLIAELRLPNELHKLTPDIFTNAIELFTCNFDDEMSSGVYKVTRVLPRSVKKWFDGIFTIEDTRPYNHKRKRQGRYIVTRTKK